MRDGITAFVVVSALVSIVVNHVEVDPNQCVLVPITSNVLHGVEAKI
jgi:hypothetical protein